MPVVIETITIKNFKTYKGHYSLNFQECFTSIYGLNGSGKSNTIDAVLFATGANKEYLRVSKYAQLVSRSNSNDIHSCMCGITLRKQNETSKRFERVYNKNGNIHEYLIDGETVDVGEYKNELSALGIDVSLKFTVVQQGTVENLADQTSLTRTAFFEDICGSNTRKKDHEILRKAVERAESELNAANMKQKSIIQDQKILKEMEEKVIDRETLMSDSSKVFVQINLCKLLSLENEIGGKVNDFQGAVERAKDFQIEAKGEMEGFENQVKAKELEVVLLKKELVEIESQQLKLVDNNRQGKLHALQAKAFLQHVADKKRNLENAIARAEKESQKNLKTIQDLSMQHDQVTQLLSKVKVSSSACSVLASMTQAQMTEYSVCRVKANEKTYEMYLQFNKMLRARVKINEEFYILKKKAHVLVTNMMENEKLVDKVTMELDRRLGSSNKDQSMNSKIKRLKDDIEALDKEKQELSQRATELHAKLDDAKFSAAQDKKEEKLLAIDSLLVQQFGSKIMGRFNILCKPKEEKHAVALTKLLLRHGDSYIVDNEQTAKCCIKLLKNQKLSMATFVPLQTIKVPEINKQLVKHNKNVRLAYDLIAFPTEPPRDISKAVKFAVGNTIVCENDDEALLMSQMLKVDCVTMNGSLYQKSGIFSGGLASLEKKAEKWTRGNKENLTSELNSFKVDLSCCMAASQEYEKELRQLQDLQLEEQMNENTVKLVTLQLKELKETKEKLEEDFISVESQLEENRRAFGEISEKMDHLQSQIEAIEKPIFAKFCEKYNADNVMEFENQNMRSVAILGEQKKLEMEKQLVDIESQIEEEQERQNEFEGRKNELEGKLRAQVKEETQMKKTLSWLTLTLEQGQEKAKQLEEKRKATEKSISTLSLEIKKFKKTVSDLRNEIKSYEEKTFLLRNEILLLKVARQNDIKNIRMKHGEILPLRSESMDDWNSDSIDEDSNVDEICCNDFKLKFDYSSLPEEFKQGDITKRQQVIANLEKRYSEQKKRMQELDTVIAPTNLHERIESGKNAMSLNSKTCKAKKKAYTEKMRQFSDVRNERHKMLQELLDFINPNAKDIYQQLTNDANASLDLLPENAELSFEGGIQLHCYRSNQRFQKIENLSGGEKTIAALALLCALQKWKPSVLIIDEIDAALSVNHIDNVGKYFQKAKENTQIIAASLNQRFLQHSDHMVSILSKPNHPPSFFAINVAAYKKEQVN